METLPTHPSNGSSGGPKRTAIQRERDISEITDLILREWTGPQITDWLNGSRPYTLTRQTIHRDLMTAHRRYIDASTAHMEGIVKKELAKLARIERKAWENFERSEQEAVTTEAMTAGAGKEKGRVKVIKRTQCGDPAYLAEIRNCMIHRAKLLGLFSAEKVQLSGPAGGAVQIESTTDLSKLSVPELEQLEALMEKATLKA